MSQASQRRKIYEMEPGEIGYTVEWAFNEDTQELNTDFGIYEDAVGTVLMQVTCIKPGEYEIAYTQ